MVRQKTIIESEVIIMSFTQYQLPWNFSDWTGNWVTPWRDSFRGWFGEQPDWQPIDWNDWRGPGTPPNPNYPGLLYGVGIPTEDMLF